MRFYYGWYPYEVMVAIPAIASDASTWHVSHNVGAEAFRVVRPAGFQQFVGR